MWSWAGGFQTSQLLLRPLLAVHTSRTGTLIAATGNSHTGPPPNARLQPQTPWQIYLSSGETSNIRSVSAITDGQCGIFSHAYMRRTLAQDTETSFLPLPEGRSNLYSLIHFFSLDSSVFELESCLMQSKFQMSNVHHVELPRLWEKALFSSSNGRHQSTHLAL